MQIALPRPFPRPSGAQKSRRPSIWNVDAQQQQQQQQQQQRQQHRQHWQLWQRLKWITAATCWPGKRIRRSPGSVFNKHTPRKHHGQDNQHSQDNRQGVWGWGEDSGKTFESWQIDQKTFEKSQDLRSSSVNLTGLRLSFLCNNFILWPILLCLKSGIFFLRQCAVFECRASRSYSIGGRQLQLHSHLICLRPVGSLGLMDFPFSTGQATLLLTGFGRFTSQTLHNRHFIDARGVYAMRVL
uniref:HDC19951 n=1 Tax=Drosophila melanogaster TaxID=7227 RepID=Q6II28_DROME|nr:TPA_inf: HDC19951 [Drosophila melanogaster]